MREVSPAPGGTTARSPAPAGGSAVDVAGGQPFGTIGGRTSVFEGPGWSLYVPAGSTWEVIVDGVTASDGRRN